MADEVFRLIDKELDRQQKGIELIASENFTSQDVMKAMGSVCTNKYAEGLPGKRYYGGCEIVDQIEQLAIDRAKELFNAEWANVQPHSGAQANAAVLLGCLNARDRLLGFDLSHGGHLTHGSPVNFSGKLYDAASYGVNENTGLVDMNEVEAKAIQHKPKLIICGASSYSRDWDYERFRAIADQVGAVLLADISHPSALIATGILKSPMEHCHIVTTTTHKTLRGPRGGMILMGKDFENPWGLKTPKGAIKMMSSVLDGAVFPGTQGGPLEHVIAAKAVAFGEALKPEFRHYCKQVVANANVLASTLTEKGYKIISGGTDNHLMLIDLRTKDENLTGRTAENTLVRADITINKNTVPSETRSPFVTSGIRLGTPAVTTRGFKEPEMLIVADLIDEVLSNVDNDSVIAEVKTKVHQLTSKFPLYSQ